ncbi:hypothetical protein FRC20_010188 [Serendipita sp. 405]|nr:hypothetical protein FRC20_010188 [Serendipita sp. 405]
MGDLHDQSMNAERIEMVFNWGDTQTSLQNHLHNYTQENYPKLSTLVVNTTQRNNHVPNEEFTHFCEYIPVSTRIKCLTLHSSYVSFTQAAIPLLSSAFSNLSSLILSTPSVEGKVCLPGLRVLYLRSDQIDISKWICPSLRHLVITPISRGLSSDHREYSSRVLPCPPTQLESLVLYSFAIEATSAFWDEHPSIQLLGFGQLQVTNQPSPIHPIKVLYNPSPYVYSTHPTYLREAIDLIPQLRGIRLIQRRVGAFTGPNEISEEWDSLYMACRRRGIEWQQEDDTIGSSPVYAWPEREKLTTDWHELSEQWLVEIFWGLVNGTLLTLSALVPLYQNTGPNWRSYQEICKVVSVFTCVTYQGLLLYSLMRKANRRLKWLGRLHGW